MGCSEMFPFKVMLSFLTVKVFCKIPLFCSAVKTKLIIESRKPSKLTTNMKFSRELARVSINTKTNIPLSPQVPLSPWCCDVHCSWQQTAALDSSSYQIAVCNTPQTQLSHITSVTAHSCQQIAKICRDMLEQSSFREQAMAITAPESTFTMI